MTRCFSRWTIWTAAGESILEWAARLETNVERRDQSETRYRLRLRNGKGDGIKLCQGRQYALAVSLAGTPNWTSRLHPSTPHLPMTLATASVLARSLAFSVGNGILGLGITVTDANTQAPHSLAHSFDGWSLLIAVGVLALCIKFIVSLALICRSYASRLSVPSGNFFRRLFGAAFLLPVFSGAAFVFYPSARDAFHSLTSNVPAVVSELWPFIQQGIAEPALIRYCFDKLGNFTYLLSSAKEALYQRYSDVSVLFKSLGVIVSLHSSILICCG